MLPRVGSPPTPFCREASHPPPMLVTDEQENQRPREAASHSSSQPVALITGSALALGSRVVPSAEVDLAFGMPVGKLRERAGIESLAYAAEGETEVTLGARAANEAFAIRRLPRRRNRLDHRHQRNASSLSVAGRAASLANRRARNVRRPRRRWRVSRADQCALGRAGSGRLGSSPNGRCRYFRCSQPHARSRARCRRIRWLVWRRRQRFSGARLECER